MKEKIKHFVKYQKFYLLILLIIVLTIMFLVRLFNGAPLTYGQESYYHLSNVNQFEVGNISLTELNPFEVFLYLLTTTIHFKFLFLIPVLLSLISFFLFVNLSNKKKNNLFNLLFLAVLFITPAFIYQFSTLNNYSFIITLALLGFFLIDSNKAWVQYLAVIVFSILSLFDISTSIILLILLFNYHYFKKPQLKDNDIISKFSHPIKLSFLAIILITIIKSFEFNLIWLAGPTLQNSFWQNLVSDFGAVSGTSIFVILLAILGSFFVWNKDNSYFIWLLILLVPSYYFNNQFIFPIAIIICFLAATFFTNLFERKWKIKEIKNFTILLLFLSILFTTLTFTDRVDAYLPAEETENVLLWLNNYLVEDYPEEFEEEAKILAINNNKYFIEYYTDLKFFSEERLDPKSIFGNINLNNINLDLSEENITDQESEIFLITYPRKLFPILEENSIKYIFIDPQTREIFSQRQGILFALRNENFKLLYSENGYEIWQFTFKNKNQ